MENKDTKLSLEDNNMLDENNNLNPKNNNIIAIDKSDISLMQNDIEIKEHLPSTYTPNPEKPNDNIIDMDKILIRVENNDLLVTYKDLEYYISSYNNSHLERNIINNFKDINKITFKYEFINIGNPYCLLKITYQQFENVFKVHFILLNLTEKCRQNIIRNNIKTHRNKDGNLIIELSCVLDYSNNHENYPQYRDLKTTINNNVNAIEKLIDDFRNQKPNVNISIEGSIFSVPKMIINYEYDNLNQQIEFDISIKDTSLYIEEKITEITNKTYEIFNKIKNMISWNK